MFKLSNLHHNKLESVCRAHFWRFVLLSPCSCKFSPGANNRFRVEQAQIILHRQLFLWCHRAPHTQCTPPPLDGPSSRCTVSVSHHQTPHSRCKVPVSHHQTPQLVQYLSVTITHCTVGVQCLSVIIRHRTVSAVSVIIRHRTVGVQYLSIIIGHCTVSVSHHQTLHSRCTVSVSHHHTVHTHTHTSVIILNITFHENLATGMQNGRTEMPMLTVDHPQLACERA